jgi:hypothetical protein
VLDDIREETETNEEVSKLSVILKDPVNDKAIKKEDI